MGSLYGSDLIWRISVGSAAISFLIMAGVGIYILYHRRDIEYRALAWLLIAALLGNGITRANLTWHGPGKLPTRLEDMALINGLFALGMAIVVLRMMPLVLRLTSRKELARINQSLLEEVAARTRVEEQLGRLIESQRLAGEANLQSYFEAASHAIIAVSREGLIGLVNGRTEEMFGYSRAELIGQPLEMLVPESYRTAHFHDPRAGAMGAGMELSGLRKDGSEFPIEIGLSYIESKDGRLALGLVNDVTERKTAEAAIARKNAEIRDSAEELRSYLEAASQAILAVSATGRIMLVNRATEEMFGYGREDLLGAEIEMLLPHRFRAQRGRRRDGTEFPIEIGLSYIETSDGNLALGLVTDITERKRSADELAAANEELRRSNAELEQFAYLASHDLQEPLRMITSYLNLLDRRCRGQLDQDGEEFLRYAVDGAERMKRLIRDFLAVSRISKQALIMEPIDAGVVVENALQNLETAIEESHAIIALDRLPRIPADPGLLAQVFQNLISNGIKFHGDRPPEIRISAVERGLEWVFSVRDNGLGIESRHAERIFRIFERLQESSEYSGSGIGLAVCKKIVERHGGRIWFESQPGAGSVFHFSIPSQIGKPREKAATHSGGL